MPNIDSQLNKDSWGWELRLKFKKLCISWTLKTTFRLKIKCWAMKTPQAKVLCMCCERELTSWVKHTSYLSRIPRIYPCEFFLAGVNFYRFNAKNWHFRQILREKLAFFYRFNAKNWHFRQILREKLAFFGVNFILQNF